MFGIAPNAVILDERKKILRRILSAVFHDPFRLGQIQRNIIRVVAEVRLFCHFLLVAVHRAVELDDDQIGILSAEDIFELTFIIEDRVRLGREKITRHAVFLIRVSRGDIGVHLTRAEIDDIQRVFVLFIKAFDTLAVMVGVTENIFLQQPHRQQDREDQAHHSDEPEYASFHAITYPYIRIAGAQQCAPAGYYTS